MESVHQRLGPQVMDNLGDLGADGMPQYYSYQDCSENREIFPGLDEESGLTLDWGDQYLNAEILLPKGEKMARG